MAYLTLKKYEYINHGKSTDGKVINHQNISLNADHTISGAVSARAIINIGEAFADNNEPDVYAVGDNTLKFVFVNEKYDCLIVTSKD